MRLRNRALLALEANSENDSVSLAKLAWSFFGSSEQTNSSNVLPHCSEERRSESLTTEIHEDQGFERGNPAGEHLQQQRSKHHARFHTSSVGFCFVKLCAGVIL
jgi:hypothetical protein